jgi:hypothetical protein
LVRLYAALPFTVVLVMGLGFANLALKTGTSLTGPLWARDDADLEAFAYWVFALLFIVAWCGFTLMLLPRFPDRIRLTWFTVGAAVSFALTLAFVGGMASDFEGSSALLDLSFASWFGFVAFASGIVAFSLVYKSHRGEGAVTATGPAD